MQRRSKRLRLQRMVESTPKAGAINCAQWIAMAIVLVDSICETRLSIGVGKCNGGARGSAYKGWWNQPQRLVRSTEWIAKAIVLADSVCEAPLSMRVGQMQRRSKMLCLQRMVESTPKAGGSKGAKRLVQSTEWIAKAIALWIPYANRHFRFGLGKCGGGAKCSTYKGWWNRPQRLVGARERKGWCAVRTLHIATQLIIRSL